MTEREDHQADLYALNEPLSANADAGRSVSRAADKAGDGMMNDHQLLSAYVQGDEQAFETLVQKYFTMVYTVASRQTGDSHLAEEIAQSVFLILSRKARRISSRTSMPGWLLRTTRFVCRDAIKMRHRRYLNEQKLALNLEHPLEPKPDRSAMELLLEEALQALRPDEQAGILAHFFEGRTFQEIAEMFAISEDAARKRTSRSLARMQSYIEKRGAKAAWSALAGLLVAGQAPRAVTHEALQSALQSIHAALKGNVASGNAVALADRAMRLLRWRSLGALSLKLGLPLLVTLLGGWSVLQWNQPVVARVEKLGKAWGALDRVVARHRQFLMQTSPNAPNYQARVQEEQGVISRESSRIIGELNLLLTPPDEQTRFAKFLAAELGETLELDRSERAALFSYIQIRLAQGATFKEAMKTLAETTSSETAAIKGMLTPRQQRLFDQVYGADGALLFSYAKAVALGTIGP